MKEIKYELIKDYISEDERLCKKLYKYIEENQITLLVAPQGIGKTVFVKSLMKRYTTLVAAPTISLAEQNEKDFRLEPSRGRSWNTFSWSQITNLNEPIRNTSTTFASASGLLLANDLDCFDLVVVDEIHKLVQYSTFSYSNVESIVETLNKAVNLNKKLLLITATPDLFYCLKGFNFKKQIDLKIYIHKDKKYFEKCVAMYNLNQERTLLKQIRENHRQNKFQIVLYNNRKGICNIEKKLKTHGINALSCTSKDFSENSHIRNIIKDMKNGNYHNYDVLLTTSWIDVGLNFVGKNINFMYCVFDQNYENGDFTIIRQFMARARNSNPILYIGIPQLTPNEEKLSSNYDLINRDERLFTDLKKIASVILESYEKGLIRNDILFKTFYGIYEKENSCYGYSDLTLRYQIHKLFEKAVVQEYNTRGIAYLLGVREEDIVSPGVINQQFYETIQSLLDDWYNQNKRFQMSELTEKIKELSYGTIDSSRPTRYIQRNYGYTTRRSNTSYRLIKID